MAPQSTLSATHTTGNEEGLRRLALRWAFAYHRTPQGCGVYSLVSVTGECGGFRGESESGEAIARAEGTRVLLSGVHSVSEPISNSKPTRSLLSHRSTKGVSGTPGGHSSNRPLFPRDSLPPNMHKHCLQERNCRNGNEGIA